MPVIYTDPDNLPDRDPDDYYSTPIEVVRAQVALTIPLLPRFVKDHDKMVILDIGTGEGIYADAVKEVFPRARLIGVEMDQARAIASASKYATILIGDFMDHRTVDQQVDMIVANPPFKIVDNAFIEHCFELLHYRGVLSLLMPLEYQASVDRMLTYVQFRPYMVSPIVNRVNYVGRGNANTRVDCFYTWVKNDGVNLTTLWEPVWVKYDNRRQTAKPADDTINLSDLQYQHTKSDYWEHI